MRSLLGLFASIPFLFVITGMIVMLAFSRTYFDKDSLTNKIIPESYNNATLLIAEHFSATDREMTSVLVERVRALITPTDYVSFVQLGLAESGKAIKEAQNTNEVTFNLVPIKDKLKTIITAASGRIGTCTEKEELKSQVLLCVPSVVLLEEGREKMKQNLTQLIDNEVPDVTTLKSKDEGIASGNTISSNQELQDQFRQMAALSDSVSGDFSKIIMFSIVVALFVYAFIQFIIQFSAHRVMYFVGGLLFIVSGMVRTIAANIAELPRVLGVENQLTYGQEQLIRFVISEPLPLLSKMATIITFIGISIIECGIVYKRQMTIRKTDTVL